ncbi:LANO_0H11144g1_1 [Lachancea nothofagi CBS 11611]|uniref:LANO_0H11144g1_1 n=1 Tax=Lachancea nothofagi CBS 11611 TaxID=1266666 RepID=A0A1G4KM92_9SACH|nr:LANO_0H11144g1_1 [Lachancea nothofagi CBS 11611]
MPSLISSQESFDEKLPSSLSRSSATKAELQTGKLRHLPLFETCDQDELLLKSINKQINRSRRILILTGAGISCNAGIPDFRSSSGLYELVKRQHPEASIRSGQEMFDISLFREEAKIPVFATFMEKLYSSARLAQPTRTHRFIAHLKNRGKLLRCYTQNIDGLEESLGLEVSSERDSNSTMANQWKNLDVVQLHGDLNKLSCTQCFETYNWNRGLSRSLRSGQLPSCPRCQHSNRERSLLGKRNTGSIGLLRPNIVLYGENHPSCEFITQGLNIDMARGRPDLFFIMGTSLKVDGVKKLVRNISKQVHERNGLVILINKTKIGDCNWHGIIDYQILSDCDTWVDYLQDSIPDLFKTQQQIEKAKQLKRENSELRKRQREERKLTPPSTPRKKKQSNSVKIESLPSPEDTESDASATRDHKAETSNIILKLAFEEARTQPCSILDAQSLPSLHREDSLSNATDTTIEDDLTEVDEELPSSRLPANPKQPTVVAR